MKAGIQRISTMLFVGAAALMLAAPTISHAENSEAEDVTPLAAVTAPQERRAVQRMRDSNVETYTAFAPGEALRIAWPEDTTVAGIYIKWYALPDSAILVQTDADGRGVGRGTVDKPLYNDYYPLERTARTLSVVAGDGMRIAEFTLYTAGDLPEGVYDWQPPVQKADLLVAAAHCDDELLFFGGTIPEYAGERGMSVQVAYLSDVGRLRIDETLSGLWHAGVRNAPVFLHRKDAYTETLRDALIRWGEEDTTSALIALIRRFRPEVIVTHDLDGEYGHGAHMATAFCMVNAVPLAADETADPVSTAAYGVWQTKKLYLHLYGENPITMDWNVPLTAFGGRTALEVANEAYHMHVSQLEYHKNVYATGEYSSADYGLAYSAVGPDEAKNDFFEHIDPDDLTTCVAPVQEAAQTATPEPAETPEPVKTPETSPEPERATGRIVSPLLLIGLGTVLSAAIVLTIVLTTRGKKKQKTGV